MEKINLLVVDDTSFMRKALTDLFQSDPQINIIATAKNGDEAVQLAQELKPDVITMDVDMPVMDGLTSLKHIMMNTPTPVVMVSALADNPEINFESWRLGGIEFIRKPSGSVSEDINKQKTLLIGAIKKAAKANIKSLKRVRLQSKSVNKISQTGRLISKVNLTIGGIGSLNTVIKIIKTYNVRNDDLMIFLLAFPERLLKTFLQRLTEISPIPIKFLDKDIILSEGGIILVPLESAASMSYKEGHILLKPGISKSRSGFFSKIPKKIFDNGTLTVLSGDDDVNLNLIKQWHKKGGSILYQEPKTCLFPKLIHVVADQFKEAKLITNGSSTGSI
jgi:two-component system chemotaxis response regulator CheB